MDYITLRKPLPTECRNTVTGNAFFYGCVEEISWFLEGRSGWLAGLSLGLCMLHVSIFYINKVMNIKSRLFHKYLKVIISRKLKFADNNSCPKSSADPSY